MPALGCSKRNKDLAARPTTTSNGIHLPLLSSHRLHRSVRHREIQQPAKAISQDMRDFWGGYGVEFKLARADVHAACGHDLDSLRRQALNLGQGTRFLIDISRFEYVDAKQPADFEGYLIYVYSPQMIVCEKLRALASPELHVARVRGRVAAGGHDIPEAKIRERYETSRSNLIRLLPLLASLRVYDNSAEGDPKVGRKPQPRLLLHMENGRVAGHVALDQVPQWAKPIMAAALMHPHRAG